MRIAAAVLLFAAVLPAQVVIKPGVLVKPGAVFVSGTGTSGGSCAGGGTSGLITFSPCGDTYTGSQTVTITTTVSGATIFYTTDGTTPSIASARYTGPITVASTRTVQAIAATIKISDVNDDASTATSGAQYWKSWWVDTTGAGQPQSTTQTFNQTPSHDASGSMYLATLSSASANWTNVLKTRNSGSCHGQCYYYLSDYWVYIPAATGNNAYRYEFDLYDFDATDGIRWMYGGQWCRVTGCPSGRTSEWDIVGNSNVPWTYSGVTDALAFDTWHHVQWVTHHLPGELITRPCVDTGGTHWPCLYYDAIIIDGTVHTLNLSYAANADPANPNGSHWDATGHQYQFDIFPKNATAAEYIDQSTFLGTDVPTAVFQAAFTIH